MASPSIPEPILDIALSLAPEERAALADAPLASLDADQARRDALWAREADSRIAALDAGLLEEVSAEEVFEGLLGP